jgi:hypothetical protein
MRMIAPYPGIGTFVPTRSLESDIATIHHRIELVRDVTKQVKWTYLNKYAMPFIKEMLGDKLHTLEPYTLAQVEERMTRPTQKQKLDQIISWYGYYKNIVKSFMKAESYPTIAPPRNISTVDTQHKYDLSAYTYAFYDSVLKHCPWYAFGKTPDELTAAIASKSYGKKKGETGDYSKMDGSFSYTLHLFYQMCMLYSFRQRWKQEIKKLLDSEHNCRGFTAFEFEYNTFTTTCSGSPDTAGRNTLANAFITYCSLRESGLTHQEAWETMGFFGGDDSLNFDLDADLMVKVAKEMGMKLTRETIDLNTQPIQFLGRFYPSLQEEYSVADVRRQLRKFWLTNSNAPDNVVLFRKAQSILVTDPNTPILSNYMKAILSSLDVDPEVAKTYSVDLGWWTKFENQRSFVDANPERTLHAVALSLDITIDEVILIDRAIREQGINYKFPEFPDKSEIKVKAVYNNRIVGENIPSISSEALTQLIKDNSSDNVRLSDDSLSELWYSILESSKSIGQDPAVYQHNANTLYADIDEMRSVATQEYQPGEKEREQTIWEIPRKAFKACLACGFTSEELESWLYHHTISPSKIIIDPIIEEGKSEQEKKKSRHRPRSRRGGKIS